MKNGFFVGKGLDKRAGGIFKVVVVELCMIMSVVIGNKNGINFENHAMLQYPGMQNNFKNSEDQKNNS
jgi:hypothetical protein